MAAYAILALLGAHAALGEIAVRSEGAATLWASISQNKSVHVKPLYASMAGHSPDSGKNWSSKPKEQVNAWNRTMQHTYHSYIPSKYQTLPSKAADIRASSAASTDEQNFKGYSQQYGGLAKVAMRGAKRDSHKRKPDADGANMPDLHEYADRYASKKSSHDTEYASYLKDYAGNEKGQDGEKYMAGTGSDYQHFSDYSDYQHFTDTSNRAPSTLSYQTYMRAGSSSGSAKWNEQYGHSSGWKHQLSGVVPSFVPRFASSAADLEPTTADAVDATQLPSAQDSLQCCWLAAASLAGMALAAGVHRCQRRNVNPPESLLG